MPKSKRDWKAYYTAKPEDRKRVDKEARKYFPVSDQAVHDQLAGKNTIGVYPLLRDETCWFLAACSRAATLSAYQPCSSVRGLAKGGHVWIFFDRPIPATVARKLGALILTRTMERRHQLGLDS